MCSYETLPREVVDELFRIIPSLKDFKILIENQKMLHVHVYHKMFTIRGKKL